MTNDLINGNAKSSGCHPRAARYWGLRTISFRNMTDITQDWKTPTLTSSSFAHDWPSPTRLHVHWAKTAQELRQAQRLRYQVFIEEMGASPQMNTHSQPGLEMDLFDPYCEHLLVSTQGELGEASQVVGTYRLLTPQAASLAGALYTDLEFDLIRLHRLRPRMVELGRSCVHPHWRRSGVILMLWSQLMAFMIKNNLDFMVGCVSVGMQDGGHMAASIWHQLPISSLAGIDRQVTPRLPLPIESLRYDLKVEVPPLMRGYLKCGAKVLGPPAWDPEFGTADFPMLLSLSDLPANYRRHLCRSSVAP